MDRLDASLFEENKCHVKSFTIINGEVVIGRRHLHQLNSIKSKSKGRESD